jgi:hypothetical protein
MSKISLSGNASGTGTLTIAAPNTDSDATINLPTVTGGDFIVSDASGNVGIGTISPNYRLNVNGSSTGFIQLTNNSTGTTSTDGLLVGNDGTGAYIIQRENDFLSIWTNNTERARIDSSGNFQFNSGYGSVATAYGCRAWVNFNGTGTVAIRASGNVSSITDNGTGLFGVNFTTALPDGNYAISGSIADNAGSGQNAIAINNSIPPTASVCSIKTPNIGGSLTDSPITCVSIFR